MFRPISALPVESTYFTETYSILTQAPSAHLSAEERRKNVWSALEYLIDIHLSRPKPDLRETSHLLSRVRSFQEGFPLPDHIKSRIDALTSKLGGIEPSEICPRRPMLQPRALYAEIPGISDSDPLAYRKLQLLSLRKSMIPEPSEEDLRQLHQIQKKIVEIWAQIQSGKFPAPPEVLVDRAFQLISRDLCPPFEFSTTDLLPLHTGIVHFTTSLSEHPEEEQAFLKAEFEKNITTHIALLFQKIKESGAEYSMTSERLREIICPKPLF